MCSVGLMGAVLRHWNGWLYGIGGDGAGAPAGIATFRLAMADGGPFPSLTGAPFFQPNLGAAADPLWWHTGALLAGIFTSVGAANTLVFIGLAGSALAIYVLLRGYNVASGAAILGALIYGFCPIRLAEAQEHFLILDGFWFVIEGGILLVLARRRQLRWAGLLGLCIAVTELDNPYLGYFASVLAASWFAVAGVRQALQYKWSSLRSLVFQSIVALAVLLIVVLPTQWSLLAAPKAASYANDNSISLDRSLGDLDRLSLRWWNFFLPFPENPILGPLGRSTFDAHLGVDAVTEQSTMIGYIALALAVVGAFYAFRLKRPVSPSPVASPGASRYLAKPGEAVGLGTLEPRPRDTRELATLALVCVGSGIIFGLPPEFRLGPLLIPTPPYFVHALLPEIRTTSRIDLVIQLGVAILAALGASFLLSKVRSPGRRNLLAGALALGIMLEYTNVPPWRYVKLLPAPPIYQWLASLTPQQAGIVVQYPIAPSDQATTPLYAFYAYDVHHHPLFNGGLRDTPPDALRRNMLDLLNPTGPAVWSALGVKTVTVETTYYAESYHNVGLTWHSGSNGFSQQLPAGLAVRHIDAGATGYAVTAAPSALAAGLGTGFGDAVLEQDGREWRWIGGQSTVWLDNVTQTTVKTVLWTVAHNNATAHTLGWPGYLPAPVSAAERETPVALAFTAQPGMHSVVLNVEGQQRPLQGGSTAIPVSLELRSLEPAPVRPLSAQFIEGGTARWTITGVSTDACTVQAGGTLDIALLWHVNAPTDADQTVFVHLLDPSGKLVAQADGQPDGGSIATGQPAPSPDVSDAHALLLPRTLPPGRYRMQAGLYNAKTMARLSLASGGDAVDLGSVTVIAPSNGPKRIPCSW